MVHWSIPMSKEANLISYKIVFNAKGNLVSERSVAEIDKIKEQFNDYDYETLQTVLRTAKGELDKIHKLIENTLTLRKYKQ